MKKITIITLSLVLCSMLFAQNLERKPLSDYFKDQSTGAMLKAVSYYSITNENSANYDAQMYLMLIHMNEMNKMISNLTANADSLSPAQLFQTANTLLSMGQYNDAIKLYDKINAKTPKWSCPWRHKGEAYMNINDYQNSEKALLMAIDTNKQHYDAYIMLAEVYYKNNNFKKALDTINESFKYKSTGKEESEEAYSSEKADFLYLNILNANKMKKEAKELSAKLQKEYPNNPYWNK